MFSANDNESVANFDNLQLVARSRLLQKIGALKGSKLIDAGRALRFALAC